MNQNLPYQIILTIKIYISLKYFYKSVTNNDRNPGMVRKQTQFSRIIRVDRCVDILFFVFFNLMHLSSDRTPEIFIYLVSLLFVCHDSSPLFYCVLFALSLSLLFFFNLIFHYIYILYFTTRPHKQTNTPTHLTYTHTHTDQR